MIELENVEVSFKHANVLKGVTAVFDGKCLVLGPNGSGKTTLLKAISGLVPYRGRIRVENLPLERIQGLSGILAVNLPEAYILVSLSALENLRLFADLMDVHLDRTLAILDELGVSRELLAKRKPWELSAGTRKAYTTAIALASGARNVLLDEPFEQLDPARKARLAELLRAYEGAVVLNTHETWVLKAFDRWQCYLIFEGVAYGPVEAGKLAAAKLVKGEASRPLLTFQAAGSTYSLVEVDEGSELTSMVTLDRVYELAIGG